MTRLLIEEYPLQVLPSLATAIGLNEAIVLQQIHYWIKESKKIHDEKAWTYNSIAGWQKQFPFWSESTIKRALNNLRKMNLLEVTDKYNKLPMDKTLWYTIDYESLNRLTFPSGQNDLMVGSKCTDGRVKMTKAIPKTITKTITKTYKDNNVQSPNGNLNERFESVYKLYPKKQGKKRAQASYMKAIKAGVTDETIIDGIKRYCFMIEKNRTAPQYIKQAGTWFFNEGWNDEYGTDRQYRANAGTSRAGETEGGGNGGGIIERLAKQRAAAGHVNNDWEQDVNNLEWFDE